MGLYDMFSGKCPFCDTDYVGQTKWFECELTMFTPGTTMPYYVENMRLEMKERCDCDRHPVAVIKDGIFIGFEKDKPTEREGYLGEVLLPDENRKENYWKTLGMPDGSKEE